MSVTKILLLGDYSGFHTELKKGLISNGCNVTLASFGDGYKNLDADININTSISLGKSKFLNSFFLRVRILYLVIFYFRKYDVVQLVNAHYLDLRVFPSRFIIYLLSRFNNALFLSACGTDAYYWRYKNRLEYYRPHEDVLSFDNLSRVNYFETKRALKFNDYVVQRCEKVIPTSPDYSLVYSHWTEKLYKIIYLPVDTQLTESHVPRSKTVIFLHGLTRKGLKGTSYIQSAFEILRNQYSHLADFIIAGGMTLTEYKKILREADVIVDQCNTYGFGMNAVFGLANGKIVMSGYESEFHELDTPIINLRPDVLQIVKEIESLLLHEDLQKRKIESRKFAVQYLDCRVVAREYLLCWNNG